MLKISQAISPQQAKRYYRAELKAEREISAELATTVSRDADSPERTVGKWHGKVAEAMSLRGTVTTAPFERLCDGRHPFTNEQLVRHAPVKHYTNRFGKEITTMEHRALWDATFSAPKSVSLAAIAGGDDRIRRAHRESVYSALNEVEKYVEARMGGGKTAERTGKMLAAAFEHDTARPDKVLRYAAPQLHTHVVIFNLTKTDAGLTKSVQPLEIFRSQKYATAVYRIELADRLRRLGYRIEIDAKTKAPEIKGFSAEYLKESSVRSQEIGKETQAIKTQFETAGAEVKNDAGIRQIAAWQGRESKAFDAEEMKTRALELEVKYDFQAQRIVGQSWQNRGYQYEAATAQQIAKEALDSAKQMAFSFNNAVDSVIKLDERQFLTAALEKGCGATSFTAVQQEFVAGYAAGDLVSQNKNELSAIRKSTESMAEKSRETEPIHEREMSRATTVEESKTTKRMGNLSMDELENTVRQQIAQKEVAQGFEILMGI